MKNSSSKMYLFRILILSSLLLLMGAGHVFAAASAGYTKYFVPGDEDNMQRIFSEFGNTDTHSHSVITVTAWSDNTTIYYDHWEDGYDFDPDHPHATADEEVVLAKRGDYHTFESTSIPLPRGTATYYDGRDYIYVAGGTTTVSRASWLEPTSTTQSVAWEVYPLKPQLTTYILPFGEDVGNMDFDRVFALIQASADNTVVTVDLNGDGTADNLDQNRDGVCDATPEINLNAGDVFLLEDATLCSGTLDTGTVIKGNNTLQIQYVTGSPNDGKYQIRGLTAFPRGFWDDEYYAPVDGMSSADTDIFLYNPNSTTLTVDYQTSDATVGSGSFTIAAGTTRSFSDATGSYVPDNSGVYLHGSDVFWGVSSIDTNSRSSDWGYSLVPVFMLSDEHFMGWAPAAYPVGASAGSGDPDSNSNSDSGLFITPAQDNTTIYIDFDNNGTADKTYLLNRLDTQYVWDTDGDLSGANIWGTSPYTVAYGQNRDLATAYTPAIDVGYTSIPGMNYVDKVLQLEKTADPVVVDTAAGSQSTYTITVDSYDFSVDAITITDTLPAGWQYVSGSTTITLADMSQVSGAAADPSFVLYADSFNSSIYSNNSENQPTGTNWTSNWIEDNDDNSPTGGNIQIQTDTAVTPNVSALWFGESNGTHRYLARIADLSGHDEVELSFDYRRDGLDNASDSVIVQVCENANNTTPISCSGSWVTVLDIDGADTSTDTEYQHYKVDLTTLGVNPNSATLAIRFDSDDLESSWSGVDSVYVRNLRLDAPLSWPSSLLGNMAENQKITIEFTAETTRDFAVGDVTRNVVEATGSRTVGTVTQTFNAHDFAFNTFGDQRVTKTSSGTDPLYPGDQITYTVQVTNPATASSNLTGIAVYDSLPEGTGYVAGSSQVSIDQRPIRATEYYIASGDFTGNSYNLTLNQDLASNYFIIVQGSDGNGTNSGDRGPDENYIALTADPFGTGDLSSSGANDVVILTRHNSVNGWVGVVTVVESLGDQSGSGFKLLDVQRVAHSGAAVSGTDTSGTAWSDINQVMLLGGFNGAGCDSAESNKARQKVCHARIWPSGSNTINWTRDAGGTTLTTATSTVMMIEWGSDWTVQRAHVTGTNGGNGADAAAEYNTTAINAVARDNTWVWGTGHTDDNGLGDSGEGVLITLGDGAAQNDSEDRVAVATEYGGTAVDFTVYALTHDDLAVDYRFKADGNTNDLTVDVPVDSAWDNRMALSYNGSNGVGTAYPRPLFSARYTTDTTVRLERRRYGQPFPAWVQGIDFSSLPASMTVTSAVAANDPPNFVEASDGYSIAPGQTLTLTFDVTIDDPLAAGITSITNQASINSNEIPLPSYAEVTNIVVNPSSSTATVGELIWLDSNGDGIKDVGESGLSGVEVKLKDQYGTPIATTTTNTTGNYQFTGIPAGSGYYVEVTDGLPTGVSQSAPAGHSDDRSDTFTLVDGQNYTDANLGYAPDPGTATLGDLVWSDADGDGVVDTGESGLGSISVQLWEDADGNGIFNPTVDTLVSSTTTASDGSYLFTGVTATGSEDYFVYVDPAQSALTDYTATTDTSLLNSNVDAGDALLNNDFGFQPNAGTAYSIQDRTWFDADADGVVDVGESGISGVTVDLLDASSNLIGSATSDSNGDFVFSGVAAGGNYTIKITDTSGVLVNYYGTTSEAVAGERTIVNLSADLNDASFGYNLTSTIGDTVFNDLNGNGTQDSGESGISGILVTLFDAGYSQLATATTDSNGQYLFTGLADGNYVVSIESGDEPSGYTFTGTDADTGRAGAQLTATLSGGNTVLTVDFGYQAPVARVISGTIWDDTNSDGVIDSGESGLENVSLDLERGGTVVATVTTDASGAYSFDGLASDSYTVKVTDTSGILDGYDATYEKTEGTTGPFNGQEVVDVTSGDVTDIRFGYIKPVPTLAVIASFSSFVENGQVVVQWVTASESGTVGFFLKRLNSRTGKYKKVNKKLLPGLLHSPAGGTYRYVDKHAVPGRTYTYKLVEVEVGRKLRRYGPYTVSTGSVARTTLAAGRSSHSKVAAMLSGYTRHAHKYKARLKKKKAGWHKHHKSLQRRGQDQFRISIQDKGIYCLNTAELSAVSGLSERRLKRLIRKKRISLNKQDREVSWQPMEHNEGFCFYGTDRDSIYGNENIYWLNQGRGRIMKIVDGGFPAPVDGLVYLETLHVEEDHWPLSAFFDEPESDYWLWDYIFSGYSGLDRKDFVVHADGVAVAAGTATLKVYLKGATDTDVDPDHHVQITLNGTLIGESTWDGTESHVVELDFAQNLLIEGDNTVTVTGLLDSGAPYSIFYIDSFDLSYERDYFAVNDKLTFFGEDHEVVSVDGFSDEEIQVFDITTPDQPRKITDVTVDSTANGNRVSFQPVATGRKYLAIGDAALAAPAETAMVDFPRLKRRNNRVDYLVITPAELKDGARELADYRSGQGYLTKVVDLEDIYNNFDGGLSGPQAIRNFLTYAYKHWRKAPQYVVLVGEGTYDYKNLMGYGDNLLPPQMVKTEGGLFLSDNALADVEGNDGMPEMAIGRLPVASAEELAVLVEKIKAYESGGGSWINKVMMAADNPDLGGDFSADSDSVAELLPSTYFVDRITLAEQPVAEARNLLIEGINGGMLLLNYIGHGGMDRLSSEGLLLTSDVAALANEDRLPVLTAMNCISGRFGVPGYDSITEVLLLHENGGTIASWAPTGLTENSESVILDKALFKALFQDDQKVLGDAILQAMQGYSDQGGTKDILSLYTLLGDPALRLW